jgi:hypothetical protein
VGLVAVLLLAAPYDSRSTQMPSALSELSPHLNIADRKLIRAGKPPQFVWVAVEDRRSVVKVDVRNGRVVRRVEVPGRPHNIAVSQTGVVAAALWGDERVALVRGSWRRNPRIRGAPHDVKFGAKKLVVANQGAAKINLLSRKGKRRGQVQLKADPHDIAISPNGKTVWATLEGSDDMAVVSLEKKKVRRYVSTGRRPHDLLFAPDGRLWVTDWGGALHVFSQKGKLIKSRSLGQEAHHLAFTKDGSQVWITDHGAHRIFVVSTRSFKVVKRFPIAGSPHHVAITSDGKKAVVADHDRGIVVVYRVSALERGRKIDVGPGPHGVWAAP